MLIEAFVKQKKHHKVILMRFKPLLIVFLRILVSVYLIQVFNRSGKTTEAILESILLTDI